MCPIRPARVLTAPARLLTDPVSRSGPQVPDYPARRRAERVVQGRQDGDAVKAVGGIGKACAQALGEEDSNIAICSRGKEPLDEVAEELREKGVEIVSAQADLTKAEDIENFVSRTTEKFNRIDILVNNAGTGRLSDLMELPEEEFRYNMDLILFGLIRCSKAAAAYMREQKWGRLFCRRNRRQIYQA